MSDSCGKNREFVIVDVTESLTECPQATIQEELSVAKKYLSRNFKKRQVMNERQE
jgi:hypothetical protein